jgi:hypothetical protein
MWPFGRKKVWDRLAAPFADAAAAPDGEPPRTAAVSVLTTIVSPTTVTSPFTGLRAALVLLELLERIPVSTDPGLEEQTMTDRFDVLGSVVLGDATTLRDADGDEITIAANRARIAPALPRTGGALIARMPPELVPLLPRAKGQGVLCYRELTLGVGDKLRLRAVVEPTRSVVADGYRSGTRTTYLARDDLAPVVLEEVFESPPW